MNRRNVVLAAVVACSGAVLAETAWAERSAPRCSEEMSALLLKHARRHGVPIDLLHRIVIRESRYNASAHHSRYYGLMQITYATAKSMGYEGKASGLLDAETNLTYAVPYLANAYMLSHGNDDRAVRLYASGYYATAKQQHMIADLRTAGSPAVVPVRVALVEADAPRNPVAQLFGMLTASPAAAPPAEARTAAPDVATQPAASSEAAAEKTQPAESGKPVVHVAAAKALPAKAVAAEQIRVAAAEEAPVKADNHMQGAAAPVSAGLAPAATPETQAPAVAAAKPSKPQLATVKTKNKPSRLAKIIRPAAPATEVADAADTDVAGDDQPAADTAAAAKASAPTKHRTRTAKKQIAAAEPAHDEAEGEKQTVHGAERAKAKPRHTHVLQAAASKADVTPDQ